jgi:hypothetical protein
MPNPPVPVEVKRKRGTARPDRVPNMGNLAPVPVIPPGEHEVRPAEAMDRVLEHGLAWLASTDAPTVTLLRESLEEREGLRAAVLTGHGKRSELRELDKQIVSMLSLLGLTPADRARLGLAEVKTQSTLAKLRSRQ